MDISEVNARVKHWLRDCPELLNRHKTPFAKFCYVLSDMGYELSDEHFSRFWGVAQLLIKNPHSEVIERIDELYKGEITYGEFENPRQLASYLETGYMNEKRRGIR